jgi:hypothetical protein
MGFVDDDALARGRIKLHLILASDDDLQIRRALAIEHDIGFYRAEVSFNLHQH